MNQFLAPSLNHSQHISYFYLYVYFLFSLFWYINVYLAGNLINISVKYISRHIVDMKTSCPRSWSFFSPVWLANCSKEREFYSHFDVLILTWNNQNKQQEMCSVMFVIRVNINLQSFYSNQKISLIVVQTMYYL